MLRHPTAEEVVQINAALVGDGLLVDAGLLASAVGRPQQTVFGEDAYPTLFEKTAALFQSLVLNHAFLDGNKRTATVAAIHLLNWNGFELDADTDEIIGMALGVVQHDLDLAKLAEFFEQHAIALDCG